MADTSGTDPETTDARPSFKDVLASRRKQIAENLVMYQRVPRYSNPQIWMGSRVVDHSVFSDAEVAVSKAKPDRKSAVEVEVNLDAIIRSKPEFYFVFPSDPEFTPDTVGEYQTCDLGDDLADALEMDMNKTHRTGRRILGELFLADGDIIAAANRISDFSGYRMIQADETLVGES